MSTVGLSRNGDRSDPKPSGDTRSRVGTKASFGTLISYAQNFEDVLLARVFDGISRGFYVDVGAHDPEYLSITKHFYDRGWRGINVEPVPAAHRNFESLRPRDVNLAFAAGREEGEARFFIPGDSAFATLDEDVAKHSARTLGDKTIVSATVRIRPLTAILEEHEVRHIDFLAIDVEGAELAVLEGLDLARYRPVVIVCEATEPAEPLNFDQPETVFTHHRWEPLLTEAGYRCVFFDGLNRFYLRSESEGLSRRFAIPVGPVRDSFRRAQDEQVAAHWKAEAAAALEESRANASRTAALEESLQHVTQERDRAEAELRFVSHRAETQHHLLEEAEAELRRFSRRADAQDNRIIELERIVEALRYGLWARDHKLDEVAGTRRKSFRTGCTDGRRH